MRAQLTHFNAVPALLACLKHFEQEEMIHQWATFIVLNLCSDGGAATSQSFGDEFLFQQRCPHFGGYMCCGIEL